MNAAETQGKLRAGGRSFLCRPRPVGGGVPIWHDAYRGERAGDFDGFPRYQVEQGNGKPPLVITGGRAVFHWAGIIDRLKGAFTSIPANFRPPERKRRVDTRMSRATPTMCRSFRGGFARALPKGGSYCFRRAKSLLAPVRVRQIARPGRLRNNPYSRRAVKNRTRSPTRARIGSGRPFAPPRFSQGIRQRTAYPFLLPAPQTEYGPPAKDFDADTLLSREEESRLLRQLAYANSYYPH